MNMGNVYLQQRSNRPPHGNAIVKGCVMALGTNKTEAAIQLTTKALGTIVPVLDQFDTEKSVSIQTGAHKRASADICHNTNI